MALRTGYAVWFTEDASEFLMRAGEHLAQDPVTATVVTTVAHRTAAEQAAGEHEPSAPYGWFATVTDAAGGIAGVAMRTVPFAPYPPYLLAMPDDAATALARALLERGEEVGGANGALPATRVFADTVAARTGRAVSVDMHTRLFRLGELVEPRHPGGRLRPPGPGEAPLVLDWYRRFHRDADEQAGRKPEHAGRTESATLEEIERAITAGRYWLWVDGDDRPVNLTGGSALAYGVSRIAPVYTPKEHRGRGYASAAVAGVSRALLDQGAAAVTLFTDLANPTSNRIYAALGFLPVADTVDLRIS